MCWGISEVEAFCVFFSNELLLREYGNNQYTFVDDWTEHVASGVAPVPEPSTMLLGTSLIGFVGFRKKFKK